MSINGYCFGCHNNLRRISSSIELSNELDKVSSKISKSFLNSIKLLVLGGENSGKTTFINQMRLRHGANFTIGEKDEIAKEIRQNLHQSIITLINQMKVLNINYDSVISEKLATTLLTCFHETPLDYSPEYIFNLGRVWMDCGIQKCYNRGNEFNLLENIQYFIEKADEIFSIDYVPSDSDILRNYCKKRELTETTLSKKMPFSLGNRNQNFKMIDIGKDIDIKPKVMQVFDGVDVIIFMISCSDFDKTAKGSTKNLLLSSIDNLVKLIKCPSLNTYGIVIFLTKIDLMEKKINNGKFFSDYISAYENFLIDPKDDDSAADDALIYSEYNKSKSFIRKKIANAVKSSRTRSLSCVERASSSDFCYFHFIDSTDSKHVPSLFDIVRYVISRAHLSNFDVN